MGFLSHDGFLKTNSFTKNGLYIGKKLTNLERDWLKVFNEDLVIDTKVK